MLLLMCWLWPPAPHRVVVSLAGPRLQLNMPLLLPMAAISPQRGSGGLLGLYSLYLMVTISISYLPNNFLFLFVSWLLHFLATPKKV
jgi:hypothetical protein